MEKYYLTTEGVEKLRNELAELKGPGRESLSKRLRTAIQQGDLSENADYISIKEEQGFLEGRIQDLETILSDYIVIDELEQNPDVIGIGDIVTIQEDSYPVERYRLVGPKEADPKKNMISHESPIGKALLGHKVNDMVKVNIPAGEIEFKVIKIEPANSVS